jgi:Raf kinase inhibitor-like YbhB/YbcL family protein
MYSNKYSKIIIFLLLFLTTFKTFALVLTSPSFENNGNIPTKYTCAGNNSVPPLTWNKIPTNTQSFAITLTDPDASSSIWTHWAIYNIPINIKSISDEMLFPPIGSVVIKNSWSHTKYDGPCPPSGTHHYIFNLYALDTKLNLFAQAQRSDLENAMHNHILASATLVGLYAKP